MNVTCILFIWLKLLAFFITAILFQYCRFWNKWKGKWQLPKNSQRDDITVGVLLFFFSWYMSRERTSCYLKSKRKEWPRNVEDLGYTVADIWLTNQPMYQSICPLSFTYQCLCLIFNERGIGGKFSFSPVS